MKIIKYIESKSILILSMVKKKKSKTISLNSVNINDKYQNRVFKFNLISLNLNYNIQY